MPVADVVYPLVAAGLICFTSAVITRLLAIRGLATVILSWLLLSYAQMIAGAWIASWPRALTRETLLIIHAGGALLALAAWLRARRPALLPLRDCAWPRVWKLLRRDRVAAVLATVVAVCGGVGAFLVVYVPPNNWDSMTCHLARGVFWMQYKTVGYFESHNTLHNDYPRGASIAQMYAMIFNRRDILAGFVQYAVWWGSMTAIYGLSRELAFGRRASLRAALLAGLLPQFLLQATSAQIDLVFAFVSTAGLRLMLTAARGERRGDAVLAGLAVALLFATKGAAPLLAPVYLACFAGCLVFIARSPVRFAAAYGGFAVLWFAVLGSESYVANYARYGALWKKDSTPTAHHNDASQVRANIVRSLVAAFEPPLRRPWDGEHDWRKIAAMKAIGRVLGADVENTSDFRSQSLPEQSFRTIQEDISWFGLTGLVLLPASALTAAGLSRCRRLGLGNVPGGEHGRVLPVTDGEEANSSRRTRSWRVAAGVLSDPVLGTPVLVLASGSLVLAMYVHPLAGMASLLAAGFLLLARAERTSGMRAMLAIGLIAHVLGGMALFFGMSSVGRYFLPAAAAGAALFPLLLRARVRWGRIGVGIVAGLASLQAAEVMAQNERKPLVPSLIARRLHLPPTSIFGLSPEWRRGLVRPCMADLLRSVDAVMPNGGRLGYVSASGDSWDFPFFGPRFEREIVLLGAGPSWPAEARRQKLKYVVLVNVPTVPPAGFKSLWSVTVPDLALLERTE